jgi:hypothetical protein
MDAIDTTDTVTDRRALLTDREREILSGEADVSEKYYYVTVTRVRDKIEQLIAEDLPALEKHETLADELRDGVCEDG